MFSLDAWAEYITALTRCNNLEQAREKAHGRSGPESRSNQIFAAVRDTVMWDYRGIGNSFNGNTFLTTQ
ncbi:MAG: hypothetical protein C4519_05915 [Desulfobacteraceae bacterium]|nr:MAG: hypothetical protein C4519_05915 [Desulfobacteraceae bacterium]